MYADVAASRRETAEGVQLLMLEGRLHEAQARHAAGVMQPARGRCTLAARTLASLGHRPSARGAAAGDRR